MCWSVSVWVALLDAITGRQEERQAHQHSNNPSQTLHHNARTLLWVEDLKSEDNFLVDSWSEVNMVPPYPPTLWIHYPH
ncbi:hypothetical protein Pmani_000477 [Petrolisthes manimaculis]|uniref:Secreted protein n=1 Tax=Petrolisthes manimaculis TaxID=1843537 RepID=A0AAE1USN5_9EUCA|nr:hypothetical protein Pmani_000477 [Petrolisthes manimaculis]